MVQQRSLHLLLSIFLFFVIYTNASNNLNYLLASFGTVSDDIFCSYAGEMLQVTKGQPGSGDSSTLLLANTLQPLALDSLWNKFMSSATSVGSGSTYTLSNSPSISLPASAPAPPPPPAPLAANILILRDSKYGLHPSGTAASASYAALIGHFCDNLYRNIMTVPPQMILYQRHAVGVDLNTDQYFFRHMEALLRKGGYRIIPTAVSVEFNISLPVSYYYPGSGSISKWGIAVKVDQGQGQRQTQREGQGLITLNGGRATSGYVATADKLEALLARRSAAAAEGAGSGGTALGTVHLDELVRLVNGDHTERQAQHQLSESSPTIATAATTAATSDSSFPALDIDPSSVSINTPRTEEERLVPPALKVYNGGAQDSDGEEIQLLRNVLPQSVLDILADRLLMLPPEHTGATSFFLPFIDGLIHHNGSLHDSPATLDKSVHTQARNTIEAVIMELIVPQLFGSMEDAISSDIIGCEWWIQTRSSESPKEYHMDTAITWCRDHGWPTEYLPSCHFYPAVGSVFYIDGEGGATAVFNQSSYIYGMTPTVPTEVGIVYPKANQMLLFKGNRYHGVMKKNPLDPSLAFPSSTRKTLLINYWSVDKIAGESDTPTLKNIELELDLMKEIRRLGAQYEYSARRPVGSINDYAKHPHVTTKFSIHANNLEKSPHTSLAGGSGSGSSGGAGTSISIDPMAKAKAALATFSAKASSLTTGDTGSDSNNNSNNRRLSPSSNSLPKHHMVALNVPRVSIPSNFLAELGDFKGQYVPNTYLEALRKYKTQFILDQYRVAASLLGGASSENITPRVGVDGLMSTQNNQHLDALRKQLERQLARSVVTESAFFIHQDNPLNDMLALSGSVFGNWDRWVPRNLTEEERTTGVAIEPTDYTYATPIFLDIVIPPEEKGIMNPVFKLAKWRAGMSGGDPHQHVIDQLRYSDFTNHWQS